MARQFRAADHSLPPINAPSDEGFEGICNVLREAKIKLAKHERLKLRQQLTIHADLAETMRRDQRGRARPREHVKKFRQQAIQFRNAAYFIDRFDTIHPGWSRHHSPSSLPWQVIEPEGLDMLASAAASELGPILTREFVTRGDRVKVRRSGTAGANVINGEVEQHIKANPGRVLRELLLTLCKIYASVAKELVESTTAGPKHHRVVPGLLTWLAEDFHRLGGRPAKGLTGPFRNFANASFEAMGLSSHLIDSHIGKAVEEWNKFLKDNSHQETSS